MNVWRCLICGDSYIGEGKPTHCAFCGAHENYMVAVDKWQDLNEGLVLSDISRGNLLKALQIEVDNHAFYDAAALVAKQAGDDESRSIFRALAKVEGEHAAVHKKLLAKDYPKMTISETAFPTVKENFEESLRRETKASAFYQQAHDETTEDRVRQVFKSLVEIESDHVALDKQHLGL